MGRLNKNGYGRIRFDGKERVVHRVLYQTFIDNVGPFTVLDHKCRQRACCNPDHLEPMRGKKNTLLGEGPTAKNARKQRCVRGHALSGKNVRTSRGKRECRLCEGCTEGKTMKRREIAAFAQELELVQVVTFIRSVVQDGVQAGHRTFKLKPDCQHAAEMIARMLEEKQHRPK